MEHPSRSSVLEGMVAFPAPTRLRLGRLYTYYRRRVLPSQLMARRPVGYFARREGRPGEFRPAPTAVGLRFGPASVTFLLAMLEYGFSGMWANAPAQGGR